MNGDDLFGAFGDVGQELVDEAAAPFGANLVRAPKKTHFAAFLSMAAGIFVIATAVLVIPPILRAGQTPDTKAPSKETDTAGTEKNAAMLDTVEWEGGGICIVAKTGIEYIPQISFCEVEYSDNKSLKNVALTYSFSDPGIAEITDLDEVTYPWRIGGMTGNNRDNDFYINRNSLGFFKLLCKKSGVTVLTMTLTDPASGKIRQTQSVIVVSDNTEFDAWKTMPDADRFQPDNCMTFSVEESMGLLPPIAEPGEGETERECLFAFALSDPQLVSHSDQPQVRSCTSDPREISRLIEELAIQGKNAGTTALTVVVTDPANGYLNKYHIDLQITEPDVSDTVIPDTIIPDTEISGTDFGEGVMPNGVLDVGDVLDDDSMARFNRVVDQIETEKLPCNGIRYIKSAI